MTIQNESAPINQVAKTLFRTEELQPDNEMFPVEVALRPAFEQREADLSNVLGLTTEQRAAEQKEFTQTIRASGLDGNVIGKRIYDLSVDARIAQLRGADDEDALASRLQRHSEETRQQLAGVYGREEAEKLLARAQKFVKQHPKLHAQLGVGGIGSRPDVVIPIVEHVRRINFR